jgi:hypothetical protein
MKKRNVFLIIVFVLIACAWFFGGTKHSNLKANGSEKVESFMDQKAKDMAFNGTFLVAK